jgi:hypothetical protein
LPLAELVNVAVFDTRGRLVETLLNNHRTVTGSITWKTERYSAGIYYLRLKAGNTVKTKKAVLLR